MKAFVAILVVLAAGIRWSAGVRAWVADLIITTGFHMAPGGTMMWPGEGDDEDDDDGTGDTDGAGDDEKFAALIGQIGNVGPRGQGKRGRP